MPGHGRITPASAVKAPDHGAPDQAGRRPGAVIRPDGAAPAPRIGAADIRRGGAAARGAWVGPARVQRQARARTEIKFLEGKKMTERDAAVYFGWAVCQRLKTDRALFAYTVISAWESGDRFKLALLRELRP